MKTLLFTILACLIFSCSDADSTTFQSTDWQNIGTVKQPLLRRTFDVTPASTTYDFNSSTQLNQAGWIGPFLVGLSGWVTNADALAGALIFDITYDDPTSTNRTVNFTTGSPTLLLSDSTSFFATPAVWMVRESGFAAWDLDVTLAGSAAGSTVHYEIMLAPGIQDDWQFFSDQ